MIKDWEHLENTDVNILILPFSRGVTKAAFLILEQATRIKGFLSFAAGRSSR